MAKGRPRSFDVDKALDSALRLFWQHGYEGTSISQLASAMGVNVPSLYAAFGNKENLFAKVLHRYGELNGGMYHDSFKKKTSREVAEAILMGEVELVTRDETPDGCLMILGALLTSDESENVRKMMSDMRAMAEGWIRDRFVSAKKEGDLPADADPAALACYIMALNSGIAVQAKSGVNRAQLKKMVRVAIQNWPMPPGQARK